MNFKWLGPLALLAALVIGGGALGEPVTRGIEAKLPWWGKPDRPATIGLRAAAVPSAEAIDATQQFTRK